MRIDKAREAKIAKRKGSTLRTVLQTIWLLISFVIAYFASQWLFAEGMITYNFFYNELLIPRTVPEEIVLAGFIVVLVIIIQIITMLGFFLGSPVGRAKTGRASARASDPDPLDDHYN